MLARKALLAACLALPVAGFAGAAHARTAQAERSIEVPAGTVLVVLPNAIPVAAPQLAAVPTIPTAFPVMHLLAEQQAMMQSMMQQMHVLDQLTMAMPNPTQLMRTAFGGMPATQVPPGSSIVTTVVSNGHGVCRQTITYRSTGHGARPQVHVVRSGDQCGALHMTGPIGITQRLPAPAAPHPQPTVGGHQPHLWTVSYPAHAVMATPHT